MLGSKIHEIVISDHAPVSCHIVPSENKKSDRIWRMNRAHLVDVEFIRYVNDKIDNFISTNVKVKQEDTPTPEIVWDAFKAYIRGMIISFSAKKNTELDLQIKEKEIEIAALERSPKKTLQELEGKLSKLKQDHESLLLQRANNYRLNSRKAFYLMANKPGKHLAALIKRIHAKPSIILKDKVSSALIRNNKVINDTFK